MAVNTDTLIRVIYCTTVTIT